MKAKRKILKITKKKAEIEIPSLSEFLRIPIDIFKRFGKKKVKIIIKVEE